MPTESRRNISQSIKPTGKADLSKVETIEVETLNYDQATAFLDSFINYEKERSFDYPEAMKLDRMRALAKDLGNPQNAFESVIIAGSKGKGSTAAILSSILRMENLRVGLYTSPHLVHIRERIQVNGIPIGESSLVALVEELRRTLDSYEWRKNPPTYFEVLTVIAFCHFRESKTHVAVLEVGLGGLYDSTNIAPARVVGIAPVSLEHTDKLGRTVTKIATQKCGVIKGREVVVSAPQSEEAAAVIQKTVEEKDATLWRVGKEIRILERDYGEDSQRFDLKTPFGNFFELELKLLGRHQVQNAAVAVGLAGGLTEKTRFSFSESAIRQGILSVRWPGRLENTGGRPRVVLDGAHNVDSVKKMLLGLKRHFVYEKLFVVFAVSEDKDVAGMLETLVPETAGMIVTRATTPRAMAPAAIRSAAEPLGYKIHSEEDPAAALEKAREWAGPNDLVVVTGSLFLIGEMKARGLL